MKNEAQYVGRPVAGLQAMLQEIAPILPGLPRLVADGVFGAETQAGVMTLQQEAGLPVTGVVDWPTWEVVVTYYRRAEAVRALPRPTRGLPGRGSAIFPGQRCLHLHLPQAMFQSLSLVLDEVEPTPVDGQHSGASVRNTLWLQRRAELPQTGVLDVATWNRLVRLYDLFVLRVTPSPQWPPPPTGTGLAKGFPWEPR